MSLHSPSVSLVGVKKRTKVIKNNVNPVWNEVCPLRDQSGGLAAFSAVLSSRGGALVWLAKESSGQQEPGRRGSGLTWVCPVMRLQRGEERGVYCLLLSGQASRTGGVLGSPVSLTQGDCVRLWSLPKASSPPRPSLASPLPSAGLCLPPQPACFLFCFFFGLH